MSIGFKKEIEEKTSELSIDLKNEIEEKTNDLYSDLQKQIKQKTNDLYSDIKDLSFVINDNFIELSKEQEKIREEYQTVIDDVTKLHKERTDEKISSINDRLDQLSSCIEEQKRQNDIVLSEFVKKIEQDRQQTYEFISNMKSEFINILREEQIKHKEEILEFKHQIKELEYEHHHHRHPS